MKRHRKPLFISVSVLGAVCIYYQMRKAYRKKHLCKEDEYEASTFLMQQAEQHIETQLRVHFQKIQRISDVTILPSILPRLKSQLISLIGLSKVKQELEQVKEGFPLNTQENYELLKRLQIPSFTYVMCGMCVLTITVLFVRVQFNILARHLYVATAEDISSVEHLDKKGALSKYCRKKYILLSEFLANEGIEKLSSTVEAAMIETLASKPLLEICSLADVREVFEIVYGKTEHRHVDWLIYMIFEALMQNDRDKSDAASHHEVETLHQLLYETKCVFESQEFKEVLRASFEVVLDLVLEELESQFKDGNVSLLLLAKLLVSLSEIAVLLLEQSDERGFIQSVIDLQKVQSFCASVYSSNG
ncbi:hypothetical protein KP509_21G048400 [Ceratopteris richardii]|nr:hypothetical protein KP509_21G048400 [Ceratopteris richardii]